MMRSATSPHHVWSRAIAGVLLCSIGCAFGEEDAAVDNTCRIDTDCGTESQCIEGVCVAEGSTELTFSLAVTPTHMPDGSPPFPMSLGPFVLDGRSRTFELPTPIGVQGRIFDRDNTGVVIPIAASLHFTPIDAPEGQVARSIPASTTDTTDLSVQLLRGVTYRVTIEPVDTSKAPYALEFVAEDGAQLNVDYSTVKWTVQEFQVEGLDGDRTLTLRALDSETGEPISSSGQTGDEPVRLQFPPKYGRYRLELSARASYVQTPGAEAAADDADPDNCDLTTAQFPVLSVDESLLRQDEERVNVLTLPAIPEPITYHGMVELCPGTGTDNLSGMPMALEAQTLSLGSDDSDDVRASYSATTTVTLDSATRMLRFCTRVLPGEYVVVVTPPANLECEIFAQRRVIDETASGETLSLRTAALLSGSIETADRTPVAQASVDARALGVDLVLPEGDATVPTYNRSTVATSDSQGDFRLPMDLGSYDIVVKPPADSGFAWQVLHDVNIDARSRNFVAQVTLDTPVSVRGTLRYPGASREAQKSLAGAEVHVYAQMPGRERSVEVGRGLADEEGRITLLVAPTLRKGL